MALDKDVLYAGPVEYVKIGSTYIYYTLDGVVITLDTENIEINTDQIPGPTKIKKVSHKIIISFRIPEHTTDNLKYALAQPDSNLDSNNLTIDNDERTAETVIVKIPGGTGRISHFTFTNCVFLGMSEVGYKKGEQAAFEVRLQALWSSGDSYYGIVYIT